MTGIQRSKPFSPLPWIQIRRSNIKKTSKQTANDEQTRGLGKRPLLIVIRDSWFDLPFVYECLPFIFYLMMLIKWCRSDWNLFDGVLFSIVIINWNLKFMKLLSTCCIKMAVVRLPPLSPWFHLPVTVFHCMSCVTCCQYSFLVWIPKCNQRVRAFQLLRRHFLMRRHQANHSNLQLDEARLYLHLTNCIMGRVAERCLLEPPCRI